MGWKSEKKSKGWALWGLSALALIAMSCGGDPDGWGEPSSIKGDTAALRSSQISACSNQGKYACFDGDRSFTNGPESLAGEWHIYTYCLYLEGATTSRVVYQDGWADASPADNDEQDDLFLGCVALKRLNTSAELAEQLKQAECYASLLIPAGNESVDPVLDPSLTGEFIFQQRCNERELQPGSTCIDYSYPAFPETYQIDWPDGVIEPNCYCFAWQRAFRPYAGLAEGHSYDH